jgi:Ala-tRNA(Pro) deacylase
MPAKRVKEYLKKQKVKYKTIKYKPVYTAQEVAAAAHIPGSQLAKTVMVNHDDEITMVVLAAIYQVDFKRLKKILGAKKVKLATEKEFKDLFPDCETGAAPPFGNLYEMKVIVDKTLTDQERIAFRAGSHKELIQLAYADFEKSVQPKIASFSIQP